MKTDFHSQLYNELDQRGVLIPLDADMRQRWQSGFNSLEVVKLFGGGLERVDERVCTMRLDELYPHHFGGLGDGKKVVNGAIISGIFDAALGIAGTIQFAGQRAGTIELSIKLMRAVTGPFTTLSICTRRTSTLAFVEAHLICDNRLCATATGICAVAGGRRNT